MPMMVNFWPVRPRVRIGTPPALGCCGRALEALPNPVKTVPKKDRLRIVVSPSDGSYPIALN
jgi:hypothetical protein